MPAPKRGQVPPRQMPSESEEETDEEEEEEMDVTEYLNDLPLEHRRRVYALKGLHTQFQDLRQEFIKEANALVKKFAENSKPLLDARKAIVNGEREVSADEIAKGEATDKDAGKVEVIESDEEEDKKPRRGVKVVTPIDEKNAISGAAADGGVPDFWLTAIKNHEVLEAMVTQRDEPALRHLKDIRVSYNEENVFHSYTLHFYFSKNEYFTDEVLTKTYHMDQDEGEEEVLERAEGYKINWTSPAKNLTVVLKNKKQRHKGGKGVRVVQREEPCESFFRFFEPPQIPDEDEEPEEEEDFAEDPAELLEMDYEQGNAIRFGLIPKAVEYYTGEVMAELAAQMGFDGGFGDSEEDEEEEEEEEEEEDEAPAKGGRKGGARGGRGRGAAAPPAQECKQQ